MNKSIARAALLSASLSLLTGSASAANFTVAAGTTDTTAKTLKAGQTGSVAATGKLSVSGNNIAVEFKGNSTLTNSGTIETTSVVTGTNAGKNRALRDGTGGLTLTVTNNLNALIETTDADVFQMNVAGSTLTLNNYGTLNSKNSSGGGNQALDFNALNTTTGGNTVYNFAKGLIQASEADAIRPGVNGFIYNSGTIKSTTSTGSSSDGIDLQTNISGVTITNAATQTAGAGSTSLIEGARHGITGGQQIDTAKGGYNLDFALSVTNNTGGTIQGDNGSGINIDGVGAKEQVTVVNNGTITGNGLTGDGDGVDIDGVVNLTNSGTIKSLNSFTGSGTETSEGVTVGGGTITNATGATIEGDVASGNTSAVGRGITLAGTDKTTTNGIDTNLPAPQTIYATTSVDNSGLIKGQSESGIALLGGTNTTNGNSGFTTTITNQATGTIEGNSATAAVIRTPYASDVSIINYGTIQSDGAAKAIDLGAGNNNTLEVRGDAAHIIGDIAGSTGTGSSFKINPGTGNSFSYSGSISNFGTVEVSSGSVTLSGVNSYTGVTKISGGTLSLSATSNNIASSSSILVGDTAAHSSATLDVTGVTGGFTVASGQTLAGHGTVVGNTTFGSGSILSPGNSAGTTTFNGNLTLGSGVSLVFDLAATGASDKVIVSGGNLLTLNNQSISDFTFNLLSGYGVGTYTLIDDSTGTISGGLSTTPGSLTENLGGYNATLSLSGNNLLLTVAVVPEPGTWAMMLGGLALLVVIQYRRAKQA